MKNVTSRIYSKIPGTSAEFLKSQSSNLSKNRITKIVVNTELSGLNRNNSLNSQVPFPWSKEYLNLKENQSLYGPLALRKPLSTKSSFVELDTSKLQINTIEIQSKFKQVRENVDTRNIFKDSHTNSDYFQGTWMSWKTTNTSENTAEPDKNFKAEGDINEYFSWLQCCNNNYQSRNNNQNEESLKRGK